MTRTDYVLAELRCASIRARLWRADIETIALALKAGLISPEKAIELIDESEALHLLNVIREENKSS